MNLSGFDLNLLRVLDALLRESSTVRAGQRIGLSQPAVSAALGRMRHALGDPLFVRQGQRIVPTEVARALAVPLREILDRTELLIAGPGAFDPAQAEMSFTIAGSDFFAELLMPKLAVRMARDAPRIRVQLVELVPRDYVATLDQQTVDLVLLPASDFPSWVDWQPVFRSSFVVIAAAGNGRLARAGVAPGAAVPIDLFCDMGHALFSPEGRTSALGDSALAALGRTRRVAVTLPSFAGVCRVVAESELIALLPRQMALAVKARLGLEIYAMPFAMAAPVIAMTWNRKSTSAPAHRWFRTCVSGLLAGLNAGEAPLG